jgi:hypothetical protein
MEAAADCTCGGLIKNKAPSWVPFLFRAEIHQPLKIEYPRWRGEHAWILDGDIKGFRTPPLARRTLLWPMLRT